MSVEWQVPSKWFFVEPGRLAARANWVVRRGAFIIVARCSTHQHAIEAAKGQAHAIRGWAAWRQNIDGEVQWANYSNDGQTSMPSWLADYYERVVRA